ncbi:sorbosone dehydrogenase family protein [Candidatus Uhrbacteria bacterium]|nr:MAG: sorbosone dehydrogenase family protein [Candidatus Uhrbacteria bacterium]
MNTRRYGIIAGLVLAIILGLLIIAWPYRGFIPILSQPSIDLSKVIPEQPVTSTGDGGTPLGKNETGMPLVLPRGFSINLFAKNLESPRSIRIAPNGSVMVAEPNAGRISLLPDADGDGVSEERVTVASNLNRPHDFLFYPRDGYDLLVAETDALSRMRLNEDLTRADSHRVMTVLPTGGRHTTKSIEFARAGKEEERILISIGSSCDVCREEDARRGSIQSVLTDGTDMQPYATGLRNSVFLEVAPDGEIWATEMGRDFLGDDLPPDEINIIEEGKNYGWPICYGKNVHDTVFDKNTYIRNPCMEPFETPSHIDLPAHSAPLGLAFVPKDAGWPEEYVGNLLVAYHGSWNRSEPTGYVIRRFVLGENGNVVRDEDFVSGWLSDQGVLGRPADLTFGSDGALYVTDDKAGLVYRIMPPAP